MSAHKDKKSKFTASVNKRVVDMVDKRATELKMTRSDIVEQAMEMWLKKHDEQEEENYFLATAAEMNADAKDWNTITSKSGIRKSEK
jgi:metal-responsive CopG/Arc/MetJ family transcriptional regulator